MTQARRRGQRRPSLRKVPGPPQMQIVRMVSIDVVKHMQAEIDELRAKVVALEEEVEMLKTSSEKDVIVLRTVSREQAKEEIRNLFATGETLFMSEVADRLNIPDRLVVGICTELQQEGELRVNDDALQSRGVA